MLQNLVEKYLPQLSIDCVVFGYKEAKLKVLVAQVDLAAEVWTLPGGFIMLDEHIDHAANRILFERTGLSKLYLEQFRVFGHQQRINKVVEEKISEIYPLKVSSELSAMQSWFSKRFVSIGYYALVDINKVSLKNGEFDKNVDWYDLSQLPSMILDHNEMVDYALSTLRSKLDEQLIGFNLLPETFTMKDLQELYEAIYDKPFARNNFQKKMLELNVLERLEKKYTGAANKAPYLYRFKQS